MDKEERDEGLDVIFKMLMAPYAKRVPEVGKVTELLIGQGVIDCQSDIENDHVAFRTIGVEHLGIESLEKIFLHYGYTRRDHYAFEKKKLDAYWYAPPSPAYPRIFISELRVDDFHERIQKIIRKYTDTVSSDPINHINLDDPYTVGAFFHTPLWDLPTLVDHRILGSVSEYAAWAIFNRYYLNHYTLSVHNFKRGYNTIAQMNDFLERNGISLNDSGGKIKMSKDGLLLQSSTVAEMMDTEFACGNKSKVSGSYVEFAERRVLPEFGNLSEKDIRREHRREGFEADNADKIFESTFEKQTLRHRA